MDKNNLNKGIEQLRNIGLSSEEKKAMLSHLSAYSESNPVPVISPFFSHTRKLVYAVVAVALILTGGTAAAAERALPGDLLYPIKIEVNEPVRGLLKAKKSKIKWEEERAVRRLDEVEKLTDQGRLDEPKRIKIEKEFEKRVDSLKKEKNDEDFKDKIDKKLEKIESKKDKLSEKQRNEFDKFKKNVKNKVNISDI